MLSVGAIIGIVAGGIALLIILAVLVSLFFRTPKKATAYASYPLRPSASAQQPFDPGYRYSAASTYATAPETYSSAPQPALHFGAPAPAPVNEAVYISRSKKPNVPLPPPPFQPGVVD